MTENETTLTAQLLTELGAADQSPCLSVYQPTHRRHPENQQDPIRFRNLIRELRTSLGNAHSAAAIDTLLKPFNDLAEDATFWNHTLDGLAVLGSPLLFRVVRLQRPVAELVIVADTFHTKPLRRQLQSTDRFQVLGLSRNSVRLFEGNRDALDEIDLSSGVPRTMKDALGDELTRPHTTVRTFDGGQGAGAMNVHHGHGGRKDESEIDTERFFREVDRAVLEHHSRPSGLPLMLAALPEHQGVFRPLSHNEFLSPRGLDINPDTISIEELRERAWKVAEPEYAARMSGLTEQVVAAASKDTGSMDLATVAHAAAAAQVARLLVESGRQIPGRINPTTGAIEPAEAGNTQVDDMLDDLAELVSLKGGEVFVVPAEHMPGTTGLAASFRY